MSKILFVFICCILFSQSAVAQLSSVKLDINGNKALFSVRVDGLGMVIIDTYGNIKNIITTNKHNNSTIGYEYYSNFNSYEEGKIKSIENIEFTYYSNFNSYEAGKVKSIGNIRFSYYSEFNDYEASKIKAIGDKGIKYYSNFNDYEAGKIKSISGISLSYYSKFNDYEAAKIKTIGPHRYEYFSNVYNNAGRLKSGNTNIIIDKVRIIVR